MPKSVDDDGVTYEFGGGTAAFLYLTDNAGTSKASQAFWSVEDVDREMVELKKRGVVFERYDDMPGERSSEGADHRGRCQGGLVQGLRRQHPGDCPDPVTAHEADESP